MVGGGGGSLYTYYSFQPSWFLMGYHTYPAAFKWQVGGGGLLQILGFGKPGNFYSKRLTIGKGTGGGGAY